MDHALALGRPVREGGEFHNHTGVLRKRLTTGGLLTRAPRLKEHKKYGLG